MRVLYLDIDSLRPDHLGLYGYHRNTSPNLDRLASEGVRFDRCYAASSPCVPARASFMSGRFGINHGALTHWGPGSEFRFPGDGRLFDRDAPLLTRHLRENGHETATFSSFADRHHANWFYAGWSETHTPTLAMGNEDADEITAALLPWLREHGAKDDWFLHVQFWDPHRNYTVDPKWPKLFEDDPPPAWPDDEAIAEHQNNPGPFTASELFPFGDGRSPVSTMPDRISDRGDFERFVDGYDGAIRFMDDEIGKVLHALDELGVLEETAVVVSADHGEAMGEFGVYGDHVCAGESVHRLPMIFRWPGGRSGASHDGLLYNVDFHPTLCELLGVDVPPGWDGRSFAKAVRGEEWEGREYLVWDHALYSCQRAVRTPDRLFVRTYHPGLFPFEEAMLFDIEDDPRQTRDLFSERGEEAARMEGIMAGWLDEQGDSPDPMREVVGTGPWKYVELDAWISRLENEGRAADARDVLRRVSRNP